MTMHLLGPAYSTIRTPRKAKLTRAKIDKFYIDWKADCKREKKLGITPKSFDDYIDYRLGYYKPKLRGTAAPKYQSSDHRKKYPSQQEIGVSFAKNADYEKQKLQVSSNYIIGQAYNKGGLVVLSKSEASDPSTGKRRC